ncbi:MAG TPA: EF-hand domain-containing protein [Azospirillaceae bacterium]|nr:EF-hand domain-containing protein [Azospirillaceae bacterium]
MRKSLIAAAALATLGALAIPAIAQQAGGGHDGHHGPDGHRRHLERLDANKDGAVDKAEFRARRTQDFAAMAEGKPIAKADFAAAMERLHEAKHKERMAEMFDRLDADKNGQLTQAEYEAAADTRFDRMDDNDDGKLTPDDRKGRHHR